MDFKLTSFFSTNEFEYFFEAKNLKQNKSVLNRRYIKTGIDYFISKKYENGSLIGYLLEGKTDETIIEINSLLTKDKRDTEVLNHKPQNIFNSIYESNHPKIGILKHLVFDFTNL